MSATVLVIGTYEQFRYLQHKYAVGGKFPDAVLWCPALSSSVYEATRRLRGVQILRLPYVAACPTLERQLIGKLLLEAKMRGNYVAVLTTLLEVRLG